MGIGSEEESGRRVGWLTAEGAKRRKVYLPMMGVLIQSEWAGVMIFYVPLRFISNNRKGREATQSLYVDDRNVDAARVDRCNDVLLISSIYYL